MIAEIEAFVRRALRWLSPTEWAIRLLKLSTSRSTAADSGLLLIQINGLSRTHLHRAMQQRHLPPP